MGRPRKKNKTQEREDSRQKLTEDALRLNEMRLEALLRLNQMADAPLREITRFALEEAVRLTGSEIGYLAFMNKDESVLTMHAWSTTAMEKCAIVDKPIVYPVEETGLWGEAVRQRQPVITNDYAAPNPAKKGYPEGHVDIARHMNIPVFEGDRIVAVAGVGNKREDYNDSDIRQLTLLMEGMWTIIRHKRTEEALQTAREELEQRVEARTAELEKANAALQAEVTERKQIEQALRESEQRLRSLYEGIDDGVFVHDAEGRILDCNAATCRRLGYTREELLHMTTRDIDAPEFAEGFEARLAQQQAEGQLTCEGIHVTKDGRRIAVDVNTSVIEYRGEPAVLAVVRDITERKRAEEALRRSEANLREAQRLAHLGNWESDLVAGTLWWSDEVYRIFGVKPEQFDGTREAFLEYIHPDDRARLKQALAEALEDKKPYSIEHRIVQPGGAVRVVHERGEVTFDQAGHPVRLFGTVQDITEHKKFEESLRNSEALYSSLVENIPQFIFRKNMEGEFTFANQKFCAILGKPLEEIIGKTDFDFYPPELAEKYRQDDLDVIRSESLFETVEENRKPDGERIFVHVLKTPIRDARGIVVGVQGIFWDITEQKRAEELLRAERDHSARIITGTPAVICGIAPDGRTNFLNPAGERITGYSRGEVVGKNWWSVFYPGDAYQQVEQLFEAFEKGDVRDYEMTLTTKHGDNRTISWNSINRFDESGRLIEVIGFGNDVTERRRAETKLHETLEELERSNRELEQFAYIASHDLQEPLRMVSSFTQMLARRYEGKLDKDADEYISYAVDGARRMQKLLNDLLAYSRVTSKARPFEPTDCESVLEQTLGNLRLAIEDTGAVVTHDPLPTLPADETQLIQLFQNLLGNALKFRGDDCPSVHVSARKRGPNWIFSVRDNGIGVAPEHYERIFQVFQRVRAKTDYPGTGIGLAICKKIVERHGGEIWVTSKPGKGTTFSFSLPRGNEKKS
jgi:PAS domain S-box-containing protein